MRARSHVMLGVVICSLWAGLAFAQFEPPPPVTTPPQPAVELGNVCWRLGDFPLDFVQLSVTQKTPIGSQAMIEVSGLWRNAGAGYQLLGSGFATQALDDQTFQIGMAFENGSSSFAGQPLCRFSANVPFSAPFNGTWSFACSGGFPSNSPIRALVQVTCVEDPTPVLSVQQQTLSAADRQGLVREYMDRQGIKAAGDPE